MAQYKETVNTEKALNLIAKMLAGKIEQIDFTKIKVSDKDYSLLSVEELQKLEELEEIRQETLVSEKVLLDDNTINVHGIIYNTELENSYYLRTIGLYANDPDEGEILYSVTPASHADYVPTTNGNNITTLIIDLKTIIDGATVNLQGNPSALVDVSMLNKKLDKGEGLEEEFDTAVKIVNELKKKQNKEDSTLKTIVKTIVGAINELYDELIKKATKTQIGRIKVGNNLTVDEDGTLHGNPSYTHPSGNGNKHIPVNGASGNFLKWLSSGAAQWANITWNDITGKPSSFPPSTHTHDDRYYTESEVNTKLDGKANTNHTHNYAATSHTHDDRYYTESEIDTKFKNFCPIPLGGVLTMWNNTNPTSLYLGTTWELISAGKYIKTGSTALQTGGNNSITLTKDNLPNTKVKVDSFSATLSSHYHHIAVPEATENALTANNYMTRSAGTNDWGGYTLHSSNTVASIGKTSNAGGGSTGTVSPSTEALGSGNAITIQPEFITLKFWKRTS